MCRTFAAHAALAIAFASPACAADPVAAPAMWQVADEDTTIYILGTFHAVRPGLEWRTPLIEEAIASADELILEVDLDPAKLAAQAPLLQQVATDEPVPPLKDRFSAEDYARFEAGVTALGAPVAMFDQFETWFSMMVLSGPILEKAGFSSNEGIDMTLLGEFLEADKPIGELEGLAKQLAFIDDADEATQQELVLGLFDEEFAATLDKGLASWVAGDLDGMWQSLGFEEMSEEMMAVMLANRNPAWADWIQSRLDTPGTVLVAGGTGHFVGDYSVLKMLEDRGVTVIRIQ